MSLDSLKFRFTRCDLGLSASMPLTAVRDVTDAYPSSSPRHTQAAAFQYLAAVAADSAASFTALGKSHEAILRQRQAARYARWAHEIMAEGKVS